MKRKNFILLVMLLLMTAWQSATAQQRRPIDSQHPLWLIHVDVWNAADPQKIIDLIPDDIKPYVCINLSLSCQFDAWKNEKDHSEGPGSKMYRMPRNAVRTYKSWASVCQHNNMWFTCQPASGGHTHIPDNDLETFEYFFKTYPNFLGWNYAEQFWAFGDTGDESSWTKASRWELFANLVEMSHKYGGFLTVSWCGGIYHFDTDPIAELKSEPRFLEACKKYPEAMLFLYKYTHCSSFYNNESACWGPFVSGLTKNYGVRYDNCGYNDLLGKLYGDNHGKTYPGSAGIGTVMEQTCVNGGAVWDGPELIWTEDFKNIAETTVNGYKRRNWTTFDNFRGIWLDMWRRIVDGTMYIPTREEVVAKTKVAIIHDKDNYTVPDALYDGLYVVDDPGNFGTKHFGDNLWYLKSTGRYGAIPLVTGFYDDAAKAIPVQVKKSGYSSRWGTLSKKVNEFNTLYPEISKGDLYVNRFRNQLVTYTPYTYMNGKTSATGAIPLVYNTCDSLTLTLNKLSSAIVREYSDHIDFYFNNYRSDSTSTRTDKIIILGCDTEPTYTLTLPETGATGHARAQRIIKNYNADAKTFSLNVQHMGPVLVTINCSGSATDRKTDYLPAEKLETPKQPESYRGPVIIEAEDMDRKSANAVFTSSGWWAPDYKDFAGMGYIELQANATAGLRHELTLAEAGDYRIKVRYCKSTKSGQMSISMNGTVQKADIEQVAINDWHEAVATVSMKAGKNILILTNTDAIGMTIDQVTYEPVATEPEKFHLVIKEAEFGSVTADTEYAVAGQTVTLTVNADEGYALQELKVVNSIFLTQEMSAFGATIPVEKGATTVTFKMMDDNMVIQPVFYDAQGVYNLDFTNIAAGTLPEGWRCTQEDGEIHAYPTSYSSGARTFTGLTGYQGKALYWRNTSAEYGRQSAYPLKLAPGSYELYFAVAAWKESPAYQVNILNASGSIIASSAQYTAAPNINGNNVGNISTAVRRTLKFDVATAGNYIIQFRNKTNAGGYQEFLLAECRLRDLNTTGISTVSAASRWPRGIYGPTGVHRQTLQTGLNIVVDADGNVKKVMVR